MISPDHLARLPYRPLLRPLMFFLAGYTLGWSLALPMIGAGYAVGVAAHHVLPGPPGVPAAPVTPQGLASR